MPDVVTKVDIKPQVIEKLESFAEPNTDLSEDTELDGDLGMGPTHRAAMALPYTKISKRYKGYVVGISECKELKTVGESIDLVYERANRRK